ncbi:MAG TPA: hypothetical protein VII99_15590, partial [Bacteroidia bacterium]
PICPGGCSTLSATGPSGASFAWYNAASNGSLLYSGANYVDCPQATTTYYVQATSANNCVNSTLTPVSIVVTPTTAPSVTGVSSCTAGPSLTVNSPVAGATYNWYSACPPSGSLLGQGVSFSCSTCSVVGTYTYYVTVTPSGCNESSCTAATVTITAAPSSVTWVGGTASHLNDWFTATNWNPACIPSCGTDVTIPVVANFPSISFTSAAAACQNFTLANGATLTFADNKAELDVCGNFSQSGTITTGGKGKIVFMGSSAQTFTKTSTAAGTLHNVEIANTGSPALVTIVEGALYQDMMIDSNLVFVNGVVITQGGRRIVVNNSNSNAISGYAVSSYVCGHLTRKVAGGASYDFPVGNTPVGATSNPYELMNLNISSITEPYITASFETPSTAALATGSGITTLSDQGGTYTSPPVDAGGTNTSTGTGIGGVWTVFTGHTVTDPIYNSAASTTASYDVTLYGRNFNTSSFPAGTYYSVIKRNTFCSASWTLPGTFAGCSDPGTLISAYRTGSSSFSQFSIVKNTKALPVNLVAFDATCVDHSTLLSWITATEFNNNYFTLERSCDENFLQYQTIATITGAGNSSVMKQYSYKDETAPGNCYYRLSQTDFNGLTKEFTPISINCKENSDFNFIGVLPNPVDNEMNVIFLDEKKEDIQIELTDMLGQPMLTKKVESDPGLNRTTLDLSEY